MSALELLATLYSRNVRLNICGGEIRIHAPKGAVTPDLKEQLAAHKAAIMEALGEGTFLDETLPDEIIIPAQVPNTAEAIKACIDAQRVRRAA